MTAKSFSHGVASADPSPDALTLWTHVADALEDTPVRLVVASDEGLTDIVATRELIATAERDFTLEVRIDGLEAGRSYYYAFETDEELSPIGRSRTSHARDPAGDPAPVRLAFRYVSSTLRQRPDVFSEAPPLWNRVRGSADRQAAGPARGAALGGGRWSRSPGRRALGWWGQAVR